MTSDECPDNPIVEIRNLLIGMLEEIPGVEVEGSGVEVGGAKADLDFTYQGERWWIDIEKKSW
jgi:hypothetical protein